MCVGWPIILPDQRTCLVVMGLKLCMISSDVNAVITPTVGVGYTLLPGRGRGVDKGRNQERDIKRLRDGKR